MGLRSLFQRRDESDAQEAITVVSGLPRSGTSMMMKMLEAAGIPPMTDELRAADDDNPKGYYEFERVKKLKDGDVAWVDQAYGKAVKVIAALLPHLPPTHRYRILFMRRAMSEILASQKQMLLRRGEETDKVSDEDLTLLFQKHMQDVYVWMDGRPNVDYIDVDYNQLLADPLPHIKAIETFLGLTQGVEQMAAVIDPSLYRQRK